MTHHDLEARIRMIEDIEAIKELMWDYTYRLDYGDVDGVVDKFLDDAKFQVRMRAGEQKGLLVGRYDGKDNIRALYTIAHQERDVYPASAHVIANPVVKVEGDRAKGSFYLVATGATGGSQGRYDNEFVRVGGKWMISSFTFSWNYVREDQPSVEAPPAPLPLEY